MSIGALCIPAEVRSGPGFRVAKVVESALVDLGWRVLGYVFPPGGIEYVVETEAGMDVYSEGAIVEAWNEVQRT